VDSAKCYNRKKDFNSCAEKLAAVNGSFKPIEMNILVDLRHSGLEKRARQSHYTSQLTSLYSKYNRINLSRVTLGKK
jgi:hypothetical protein